MLTQRNSELLAAWRTVFGLRGTIIRILIFIIISIFRSSRRIYNIIVKIIGYICLKCLNIYITKLEKCSLYIAISGNTILISDDVKDLLFCDVYPFGKEHYFLHKFCRIEKLRHGSIADIGGFIGDTLILMGRLGYKSIIYVEPIKKRLLFMLMNVKLNNIKSDIKIIGSFIDKPSDIAQIIESYDPLVIKMDCEGCEKVLYELDDKYIKKPYVWIIEYHDKGILKNLIDIFSMNGFSVIVFPYSNVQGVLYSIKVKN